MHPAWAEALQRVPEGRRGAPRSVTLGQVIRGGTKAPAVRAVGESLTLGDFTIKPAELPYVMPGDLIWTSLPGDAGYLRSLKHLDPSLAIPAATRSYTSPACGRSAPDQSDPSSAGGWVAEALNSGQRFFVGGGVWGCSESMVLRGIIGLFDRWITASGQMVQLTARQISPRLTGTAPPEIWKILPQSGQVHGGSFDVRGAGLALRWPIEVHILAQALHQELLWARKTFALYDLLINAYIESMYADWQKCDRQATCLNPSYRDPGRDPMTYDKLKALIGFTTGSQDLAVSSLFGGEARPLLRDIYTFVQEAAILVDQSGALQEAADGALGQVVDTMWSSIKDFVLESGAIEDVATFAGTVANSVPFVGQWAAIAIELTTALFNSWTKDTPEFGIGKLYRGQSELSRKNLEIYVTMMYRAMQLQYLRLYYLVQVPESSLLLGTLRPRETPVAPGGGVFRPGVFQPAPVVAEEKALSAGAKTGLVVGSGVAAAALVWWLWRRRR